MKKLIIFILIGIGGMVFSCSPGKKTQKDKSEEIPGKYGKKEFEQEWAKVDQLIEKQKPRSAVAVLENIYKEAREEYNPSQQVKSLVFIIKMKDWYEEDPLVNGIKRLEKEAGEAYFPLRSVLQAYLADLYRSYYRKHRYKILGRTSFRGAPPDNIRDWAPGHFRDTITNLYLAALKPKQQLLKFSPDLFSGVLENEGRSRELKPTLYDLLSFRALNYFSAAHAEYPKPVAPFSFDDPAFFASAEEFASIKLSSPSPGSFAFLTMSLYRELLQYHLKERDTGAVLYTGLQRLKYVYENAALQDRKARYYEALERLTKAYPGHELTGEAWYALAGLVYDGYRPPGTDSSLSKYKLALRICKKGLKQYPGSAGGQKCHRLKERILSKKLDIRTTKTYLPNNHGKFLLEYRNLSSAGIRVVKIKEGFVKRMYFNNRDKLISEMTGRPPVYKKTVKLPDSGDHRIHRAEVSFPPLAKGRFLLLVSDDTGFALEDNKINYTFFQVTRLSLQFQNLPLPDGNTSFYVTDAGSGRPLQVVRVKFYTRDYDKQKKRYEYHLIRETHSGNFGGFNFIQKENRRYVTLSLHKGNDAFYLYRNLRIYQPGTPEKKNKLRTFLFTGRSIYRPGQKVYFKGILVSSENEDTENNVVEGEKVTVKLKDVNREVIDVQEFETSSYGSFHGSFSLPSGVLTGRMYLETSHGRESIRVEEYKRPQFEVKLPPLEGNYKLGEQVRVKGEALTYTNLPLQDARVRYRVYRKARFPGWWRGWGPLPSGSRKEITHGMTRTGKDGNFQFTFLAEPDRSVEKKYRPVFHYSVEVDVIDRTGETHSASNVIQAGYASLKARLELPDWAEAGEILTLEPVVTNLSGKKVNRQGTLSIRRLQPPGRLLRNRYWSVPGRQLYSRKEFIRKFPHDPYGDENRPVNWKKQPPVYKKTVRANRELTLDTSTLGDLETGYYKVAYLIRDRWGNEVRTNDMIRIYRKDENRASFRKFSYLVPEKTHVKPGGSAQLIWGSADDTAWALMILEKRGKTVLKKMLRVTSGQKIIKIPVKEEDRGSFHVHLYSVNVNRYFDHHQEIRVPWDNKKLDFHLETFRDKLKPGKEETWKIKITGPGAKAAEAEVLAGMYDASLDAFQPHNWSFSIYPRFRAQIDPGSFTFGLSYASYFQSNWIKRLPAVKSREFERFNDFGLFDLLSGYKKRYIDGIAARAMTVQEVEIKKEGNKRDLERPPPTPADENNTEPQFRKDLRETAFFFPALETNEKGEVEFTFTTPEALTRWKVMFLGHNKSLQKGQMETTAVTRKKLMVRPNAPRFLRVGDRLEFAAKVTNLTEGSLKGKLTLELFNGLDMQPLKIGSGQDHPEKVFHLEPEERKVYHWTVKVPEGLEALTYRVYANTGEHSDGVENALPVLPSKVFVTESLPLWVTGKKSREFDFEKLQESKSSKTLRHYNLTLEMASNPAWYAVQSLPYLMDYPHECSEQVFNRFYANRLSMHIIQSNPGIREVFEKWKNSGALLSDLQKDGSLKSLSLTETPWVQQAKDENARKKMLGKYFDEQNLRNGLISAVRKLSGMQSSSGAWPWFNGMHDSWFITQYIVSGFGHLRSLGISLEEADFADKMVSNGLQYIDGKMNEAYQKLLEKEADLQKVRPGHLVIQYLYARSFFREKEISRANRQAFEYWLNQGKKFWTGRSLMSQAMLTLAFFRYDEKKIAREILASFKERALKDEEMGMYWKTGSPGYYWYQAPVETQALMIEAFEEIDGPGQHIEKMKAWLLKQKQVQSWGSTKATAGACYALLLRGSDWLSATRPVKISLGTKITLPQEEATRLEAGTGYYRHSWQPDKIDPGMGKVKVTKETGGIAWGALHWQYFESLDNITPHQTPLKLKKKLFKVVQTAQGPEMKQVTSGDKLSVGDLVRVRLVIRMDRTMEYIHLKDMRAAALEPTKVHSGYRYQGGLGYYKSIRDASVNFFFNNLPGGSYVLEYDLRVTQRGVFENGMATIRSMYAPEFNSHSASMEIMVE